MAVFSRLPCISCPFLSNIKVSYPWNFLVGFLPKFTASVKKNFPLFLLVGLPSFSSSVVLLLDSFPEFFPWKTDNFSTSLASSGSEFHPSTTCSPKLFNLASVLANFFVIFHCLTLAHVWICSSLCWEKVQSLSTLSMRFIILIFCEKSSTNLCFARVFRSSSLHFIRWSLPELQQFALLPSLALFPIPLCPHLAVGTRPPLAMQTPDGVLRIACRGGRSANEFR